MPKMKRAGASKRRPTVREKPRRQRVSREPAARSSAGRRPAPAARDKDPMSDPRRSLQEMMLALERSGPSAAA